MNMSDLLSQINLENKLDSRFERARIRFPGGHITNWTAFNSFLDEVLPPVNPGPEWERLEARGVGPCAAFDADGTLWKNDITIAVVREAIRRGVTKPEALERINSALARYYEPAETTLSSALARLEDA